MKRRGWRVFEKESKEKEIEELREGGIEDLYIDYEEKE